MKTGATIIRFTALLTGITAPAIAAAEGREDTSFLVIYIFLSFCGLIIIGQLIPLISSLRAARKAARQRAEELDALCESRRE